MESALAKRLEESLGVAPMSRAPGCVIATGGGVVLNPENMERLRRVGEVIHLYRSLEDIERTIATGNRPLLHNNPGALRKLYEARLPLYRMFADRDVENATPEKAVAEILREYAYPPID